MAKSLSNLLVALALITSPAAAQPTRRGLVALAIHPAQHAVAVGEVIAAWSPDLRSVLGFDLDGRRLWRVATGDQGGLRDLGVLEGRFLVHAGTEGLIIEPSSGKVLGRRSNVALLGPGDVSTDWCRVDGRDGVCALRCACSFELVQCDTLATRGPRVQLPYFEELEPDGMRASHCPIFSGAILGRAGDALIASFPVKTDKPFFGVPEEVTAISATTGEVLWRAPELGRFDPELSGVGGDGVTCFVGSRSGSLIVFDCQRASPAKWRRTISIIKGIEPQIGAIPTGPNDPSGAPSLLVRDGPKVVSLALATGAVLWSAEVPPRSVALTDPPPSNSAWHRFVLGHGTNAKKVESVTLLESATGRRVGEMPLPLGARSFPRRTASGWLGLGEKELVASAPDGATLQTLALEKNRAPLDAGGFILVPTGKQLEVHGHVSGTTTRAGAVTLLVAAPGELAGARPITLVEQTDGFVLVVLRESKKAWDALDPETFGELHVLRWRR